ILYSRLPSQPFSIRQRRLRRRSSLFFPAASFRFRRLRHALAGGERRPGQQVLLEQHLCKRYYRDGDERSYYSEECPTYKDGYDYRYRVEVRGLAEDQRCVDVRFKLVGEQDQEERSDSNPRSDRQRQQDRGHGADDRPQV